MKHCLDFTTDWFEAYQGEWAKRTSKFVNQRTIALEIGSYEGRSALWMMQNVLVHKESRLVCIDPWDSKDATLGSKAKEAESRFINNLAPYKDKMSVLRTNSIDTLCKHRLNWENLFSLIYVDGSHEAMDALTDLLLCWPLLNNGGLLVFDDYTRTEFPGLRVQPKEAWDAFVVMKPIGLKWETVGRQVFATKELM